MLVGLLIFMCMLLGSVLKMFDSVLCMLLVKLVIVSVLFVFVSFVFVCSMNIDSCFCMVGCMFFDMSRCILWLVCYVRNDVSRWFFGE